MNPISESLSRAETGIAHTRVVVSIVAWKGSDLTIDCLRSVANQIESLPDWHVFVVDNASPDDSADRVAEAIKVNGWSSWVTFIRASHNGGFASGNNIAIRAALSVCRPEFVLLLNPDTIVLPDAFRVLCEFMRARPDVGVAGGRNEDVDATPQHCCFRFPHPINELSMYLNLGLFDRMFRRYLTRIAILDQPCCVDWVSGSFMMIRTEVIDDIGLMDEGYFLYYEETDFTLRAKRAGWNCWHVPQSRIVHLVGQSSGITTKTDKPKRRPAYWFESRRRYFVLNHGRFYAICADMFALCGLALGRIRRFVERKPDLRPPHFMTDLVRHSSIFNGRGTIKPRITQ